MKDLYEVGGMKSAMLCFAFLSFVNITFETSNGAHYKMSQFGLAVRH